mmetsp:Transcript_20041/g.30052  ORF Transcript_20041/g.30052 Transcript_20041/m.30052 type:complete len:242 (-) Transcript_20041:56-781(-)
MFLFIIIIILGLIMMTIVLLMMMLLLLRMWFCSCINMVMSSSSSSSSSRNDSVNVSLGDLKGELLEIKGILREKQKQKREKRLRLPQTRAATGEEVLRDTQRRPMKPSSALVPSMKNKRYGNSNNDNNSNKNNNRNSMGITAMNGPMMIPQSEIDAFNESVELSSSEKEILNLLSQGYTNAEIAKLRKNTSKKSNSNGNGVSASSTSSVSRIISTLYSKTLTKTRTELVKWGLKMGHIPKE